MSIVSVSRRAGPRHDGQAVSTNSGICARGESPRPLNSTTFGSSTGRSSSGTGCRPQARQWMMGMGVPQ